MIKYAVYDDYGFIVDFITLEDAKKYVNHYVNETLPNLESIGESCPVTRIAIVKITYQKVMENAYKPVNEENVYELYL